MPRRLEMALVHPDIIPAAAGKTGARRRITQTFGVSWNSGTKIAAGDPGFDRSPRGSAIGRRG
ncbi:hypothetical protein [Sphingomonas quercus]|uniref:Uncharacterized protein n=1 Tax=Sphingomonas quercus TaxID=2842451 RepID=A0ABS6BJ80_9SPHN|nr:hypothetical protein [Sphingomonas quercus]MBU3077876.1 hypothetical protein [Sphingomonas quercus]